MRNGPAVTRVVAGPIRSTLVEKKERVPRPCVPRRRGFGVTSPAPRSWTITRPPAFTTLRNEGQRSAYALLGPRVVRPDFTANRDPTARRTGQRHPESLIQWNANEAVPPADDKGASAVSHTIGQVVIDVRQAAAADHS